MPKFLHPPPAPPAFGQGKIVPEVNASPISKLLFNWLNPFLQVGYSRPLEKDDLWDLQEQRHTQFLTDQLETSFFTRVEPEKRPPHLRNTLPEQAHYDQSLWKALYQNFRMRWLLGGLLFLVGGVLTTTSPLVTRELLQWLSESYYYNQLNEEERAAAAELGFSEPRGIGFGIGMAFSLFAMAQVGSLTDHHGMLVSMANGLYVRAGVIGNIFRKSLRLSGKARVDHSIGQITTMISTDATRLDTFAALMNYIWIAPIQIAICIGLLIHNLGVSALVGLGVLIFSFPIQTIFIVIIMEQRKKGVKITDSKIRLVTEVLQGIRLIKLFAWEEFYKQQIIHLRTREVATLKKVMVANASLMAMFTFAPVLAATLSFVTYSLLGNDLNVAIVFSSLQLINTIQFPLILLPVSLSAFADATVAFKRISAFLLADELQERPKGLPSTAPDLMSTDVESSFDEGKADDVQDAKAVDSLANSGLAAVINGSFSWEVAGKIEGKFDKAKVAELSEEEKKKKAEEDKAKAEEEKAKAKAAKAAKKKQAKKSAEEGLPVYNDEDPEKVKDMETALREETPFALENLHLKVPKGSFVTIVGRVGSGKSSALQALIGEMRKTSGEVVINGKIAYVPQTAWIRNMTLKENVLFGQEFDELRFAETVKACCLEPDLAALTHGAETEIGEKGINLSGGQKARVSLARAVYSQADISLLDDPLSAVDAYVGKYILENCLLNGPLATRTRVLVTHALHVLDKSDYIYVMDNGVVAEEGTYQELMARGSLLTRIMEEYGNVEESVDAAKQGRRTEAAEDDDDDAVKEKSGQAALMQEEERETGSVPLSMYKRYLKQGRGLFWLPLFLVLITVSQAFTVGNGIFLGIWTRNGVPGFGQKDYIGIYAGLGAGGTAATFFATWSFYYMCLQAAIAVFTKALGGVLRSPVSMFDTTPMGRIISRLSKDQDTLDTSLAETMFTLLYTVSSVFGTIFLVFYTFPLLGIIFVPLGLLYYGCLSYYRRSSVEVKRLDSLIRSQLYSTYSETLTGLATVRAYNMQASSIKSSEQGLDMQNKAYYMTVAIQRWLALRLDLFANTLNLGIGLFAAGYRHTVDPSKVGVVLTYSLSITYMLSEMVTQFATVEQHMNAVERVLVYSDLPAEGERSTKNDPPQDWPQRGEIDFKNVELGYREDLPLVLKQVSFSVKAGEKVGVVGRTGAGKSSLLQGLFRTVSLRGGSISIDEVDIATIGLDALRSKLALVPQDNVLFLGTLRENIDPMGTRTDAELISVLQRCWLLPEAGKSDPVAEAKFDLNATVGDEGSNYSAGEKQLLALARALVKNSRIIVLDEATSSVDVETDAKIQRTIQIEFSSSTLICIAHRLNTVAYYDRVLVMDAGNVAEFDTVLNLFDNSASIFRSLCDEAGLSRADILRIRSQNVQLVAGSTYTAAPEVDTSLVA